MTRLQSRPVARCRSTASDWRRRTGARLGLVLLASCLVLASSTSWAWNPYDADSSWSSGSQDGVNSSRRETADYGWETRSRASDWGERDRWRETYSDRSNEWRQPDQRGYRTETADDRSWRARQEQWPREYGSDWDGSRQRHFGTSPDYAPARPNGYQFRHDPKLDDRRPGHQNGWVFRPLSEQDNARSLANNPYPQIDERDYLPRGPWRSYEDEGATFGYHPDDGWPSTSPQLR